MMKRRLSGLMVLVPFTLLAACGGGEGGDTEQAPASETAAGEMAPQAEAGASHDHDHDGPAVHITAPAEGAEVEGPDVRVVLEAHGILIRPAGDMTPNTGHHHLYLDHDLTDPSQPVPTVEGQVIHMGDGSSEYTFQGVEPGEHRIIAVLGDYAHVPLQPWVVDTVHFTVR